MSLFILKIFLILKDLMEIFENLKAVVHILSLDFRTNLLFLLLTTTIFVLSSQGQH